MKLCRRCGTWKPVNDFHRSSKRGHQAWCKPCRRDYDAAYHRRRRDVRRAQAQRRNDEYYGWARDLKSGTPCADCGGVFHPAAMHWDHLPGAPKLDEVGNLIRRGRSRGVVLAEIAKCDLVCANCHAVRTVNRRHGA